MNSSSSSLNSISEIDINPNMIDPPTMLHMADVIHRMINNLLLSLSPNIREIFIIIFVKLIPAFVIFPVMDPKILNDAPIVTTLTVSRTIATVSITWCRFSFEIHMVSFVICKYKVKNQISRFQQIVISLSTMTFP